MISAEYARQGSKVHQGIKQWEQIIDKAIGKAIADGQCSCRAIAPETEEMSECYGVVKGMYTKAGYEVNEDLKIFEQKYILDEMAGLTPAKDYDSICIGRRMLEIDLTW